MKSNTQNAKIEAITEKTLVLGIDVGSETHYSKQDQSLVQYIFIRRYTESRMPKAEC